MTALGLAEELTAGSDHYMNLFSTFEVTITLTKKGVERFEEVANLVFSYL